MTSEGHDRGALADAIADWLRRRLDESLAERFVLGLSGGIDSAVVCALCCRAVGADRVLAAIMPANSSGTDAEHAALVAQTSGVAPVLIDLSPVLAAFLAAMPLLADDDAENVGAHRRLADANLRPRLRMTALYHLANQRNGLIVGTGNKSEAMVGYFTKYGDGGVDVLPIVDLYKYEVRARAHELGVPEAVIAKPPSAGLWADQTDEAELGLTYDQLDAALAAIERDETETVDAATLDLVRELMQASQHKRRPIPSFRRSLPAREPRS